MIMIVFMVVTMALAKVIALGQKRRSVLVIQAFHGPNQRRIVAFFTRSTGSAVRWRLRGGLGTVMFYRQKIPPVDF